MTNRIKTIRTRTVLTGLSIALLGAAILFALPSGVALAEGDVNTKGYCRPGSVNEEMWSDCHLLLLAKDKLDGGSGVLNWSRKVKIKHWTGVRVGREWTRIKAIQLPRKGLTGSIPARLSKLIALENLNLTENELTGRIPPELGRLTDLEVLKLGSNKLNGKIPSSLGKMKSLREMDLGDNNLKGKIPLTLLNLENLNRLILDRNNLKGEIPAGLGNLKNLEIIWLSHNQLTGTLPPELVASGTTLQYLRVKNNRLTGKIPDSYGGRDWKCLLLRGNDLEDECLPRSLRGRVKTQDMPACPK